MSQTETQFRLVVLREMCPNEEFFWSVFSRIRTEYGEILGIQSNAGIYGPENSVFGHFSRGGNLTKLFRLQIKTINH